MELYEYINMVLLEEKPKTNVYQCNNNKSGAQLGIIKWYPAWRQYCYFPTHQAVYSKGCLKDICSFLDKLRREREKQSI